MSRKDILIKIFVFVLTSLVLSIFRLSPLLEQGVNSSLGLKLRRGRVTRRSKSYDYFPGWGVVAMNTNKKVYAPGEKISISFAVLDASGNMTCDSKLRLEVTVPKGKKEVLSTDMGTIRVAGGCGKSAHVEMPSYVAEFIVEKRGLYEFELSAETSEGVRSVSDYVRVRRPIPSVLIPRGRVYAETRANTVEFFTGFYTGDGSTGQDSDTPQSFPAINLYLAESSVDIKNAFVMLEIFFEGYDSLQGSYDGYEMAFDACVESCTADAFGGSGNVNTDDNTVLAYEEGEGNFARLLLDVTDEATLAAYTGSSTNLEVQVGYQVDTGSTSNSIAAAMAKLVITYEYDGDSSNFTNTVVYPLDSNNGSDVGSRTDVEAACTVDSSCETFAYNVEIPELGTRQDTWFDIGYQQDSSNNADRTFNINIDEDSDPDTSSVNYIHEGANAGAIGVGRHMYWSVEYDGNWSGGNSGFAENSSQNLEIYLDGTNSYGLGGLVYETYSAASSAGTKTRTVRYPLGEIQPAITTTEGSSAVDVYFAETGVDVKSAFVRLRGSLGGSNASGDVLVATDVGAQTKSGQTTYNFDAPNTNTKNSTEWIHIITASGDITELESATADTPVTVTVYTQLASATYGGGTSGELYITYTYTGESAGYLTSLSHFAGQQDIAPAKTWSTSTGAIDPTNPESTGTKTIRGAALDAAFLLSDNDGTVETNDVTMGAALSTSTCSASDTLSGQEEEDNTLREYFIDVTSSFTDLSGTYTACYSNDGAGDVSADAGGKHNGILNYIYQWDAPSNTTFTQNDFEWFVTADSTTLTNVWPSGGGEDLAENAALTQIPATNEVLKSGDQIRIQMNFTVATATLASGTQPFKLEYDAAEDCTAASGWTAVGEKASGSIWRLFDESSVADSAPQVNNISTSTSSAEGFYLEVNDGQDNNPSEVLVTENSEWDWPVENNGAVENTTYCFRMVLGDGTAFGTYNADGYPKLTMAPGLSSLMRHGNIFQNNTEQGFFWAD